MKNYLTLTQVTNDIRIYKTMYSSCDIQVEGNDTFVWFDDHDVYLGKNIDLKLAERFIAYQIETKDIITQLGLGE